MKTISKRISELAMVKARSTTALMNEAVASLLRQVLINPDTTQKGGVKAVEDAMRLEGIDIEVRTKQSDCWEREIRLTKYGQPIFTKSITVDALAR